MYIKKIKTIKDPNIDNLVIKKLNDNQIDDFVTFCQQFIETLDLKKILYNEVYCIQDADLDIIYGYIAIYKIYPTEENIVLYKITLGLLDSSICQQTTLSQFIKNLFEYFLLSEEETKRVTIDYIENNQQITRSNYKKIANEYINTLLKHLEKQSV